MIQITDPDIVERIAHVDGCDPEVLSSDFSEYGIVRVTGYWRERNADWDASKAWKSAKEIEEESAFPCGAAIYGSSGWNRYYVIIGTGEVVLSTHHASESAKERAASIGMRAY